MSMGMSAFKKKMLNLDFSEFVIYFCLWTWNDDNDDAHFWKTHSVEYNYMYTSGNNTQTHIWNTYMYNAHTSILIIARNELLKGKILQMYYEVLGLRIHMCMFVIIALERKIIIQNQNFSYWWEPAI